MDYITLMAKKSKTKSDWMLEKWADANGYLDDPDPSVNVKVEQELEGEFCRRHHKMYDEHSLDELDVDQAEAAGDVSDDPYPNSEEAGKDYAGTCTRCGSDNTKKTKSQTGGMIGLCNDCGETWKLKEAPEPEQKGGEIPLGKAGKPSDVSKVSKPLEPSGEMPEKGEIFGHSKMVNCPHCGNPFPNEVELNRHIAFGGCSPYLNKITSKPKEVPKGGIPDIESPIGNIRDVESPIEMPSTPATIQQPATQPTQPSDPESLGMAEQQAYDLQIAWEPHGMGHGYIGKCNICDQEFSMSSEEAEKFGLPMIEIKNQIHNHFTEKHPDMKNPIGEFFEEPDPSNPDKELNPNPELPPPVDATAPNSNGDNKDNKPTEPTDDDSQIHMKPQTYSANGVELPDKVEIPERLFNDLMMMIEYSKTNDNEAGGFLIIAKHGDLGVVGEQFGKDREIVLEPNEQLHEGESLIGTVHMHPVTPTASTGDVTGYLNDKNEKVMVVVGADKSINFFFKVPDMTQEGDYGDEISDNFEQSDMGMMAEGFGFIWYRGEESDRTELHLMDNIIEDIEFDVLDESWPVEDVVKALGIKGRPDIPEEYSTKKTPLRLQIPFSYCNERRLI